MENAQGFDDNLEQLYSLFHFKADTVTLYTKEVEKICSTTLAASNVRHPPITSRVKSWESAKGSLYRRYEERLVHERLRKTVETQGRSWDEYSQDKGLTTYNKNMMPFETPEEMISALHDFGGIRISLYFPGDLERVGDLISRHFEIVRRIDKGDKSQVGMQGLKERLSLLEDPEGKNQTASGSKELQPSMRTFMGYKATHFVVKLKDEDISPERKYGWKNVAVEIQVGTLVMHVWSEIEHDMIYKPLDSQGEGVSEDEERILDLINGIVLTGEAALRQLEASTAKRLNQRAQNKDITASSHYELATWIERDCKERGVNLEDAEWKHLEEMFAILKVAGSHRRADVTNLLEAALKETSSPHSLPAKMLKKLCEKPICLVWRPINEPTISSVVQNARLWALRLVHSLNIAIYLDVFEEVSEAKVLPPTFSFPSFTSFLDILHPEQPRYTSISSVELITKFCKSMMDRLTSLGSERISDQLVDAAIGLPSTNMVASIAGSGNPRAVPIPGLLIRFLSPPSSLFSSFSSTEDTYRELDLIEAYMISSKKQDDQLVIWDSLTSLLRHTDPSRRIEDRFFTPVEMKEDSNTSLSRWCLFQNKLPMAVQKIDSDEVHQLPVPREQTTTTNLPDSTELSEPTLHLAYHLYPEEEWEDVRKAWGAVKALKRDRRLQVVEVTRRERRRSRSRRRSREKARSDNVADSTPEKERTRRSSPKTHAASSSILEGGRNDYWYAPTRTRLQDPERPQPVSDESWSPEYRPEFIRQDDRHVRRLRQSDRNLEHYNLKYY